MRTVLGLVALVVAALGFSPRVLLAQNITDVQVTPEQLTLKVGQRQTLFAAAFDRSGNLIPTARFRYSTNSPATVRVLGDGTVVGLKPGLAVVEVRSGQQRATVAVSVADEPAKPAATHASAPGGSPPPGGGSGPAEHGPDTAGGSSATSAPAAAAAPTPATAPAAAPAAALAGAAVLAIEPATIYLLPSENVRATARALREDGSPVGAVRVVWKSLRPDVATVDAEGVIVGLVPGHGIVQASIPGGLTATVPVEVSQAEFRPTVERLVLSPGDLDTLEVVIPSQGGRPLRNGLQWRSTDPAVVRVGPTGIVQAMGPGQAEVVVSGFFQERRIAIQVHRPIETLVVSPRPSAGPLRVPLQGTRTVAARAEAADSTVVPEAPFRWEVGDTSVVAFDPATGTLTGRALGTTSLSLRLKGFALTNWVVEVIPGGIALSRGRLALAPGERAALTPILLDDKGNALGPVAEARWSSSDPQVARVGADGTVEAAGIGHATVTAGTPWGKSAAAEVYVVGDLLLTSNRRGVGFGIHQLRAAAPEEALPVLADSAINLDPVWSPDRTRIAFSSNRSGDFELYLMDADGRNLRRLTEARGVDDDPSWTPDGRQLVFTSERTGTKQIHLLTLETGEIRALTASPGGNQAPVVSPDGRSIAFVSARDGNHEVYLMDLDGGNQRNLTRTAARESAPRFFPNGDLLYAVDRPGKGAGAALMRLTPATGAATTLGTTDHPVTALAVSRDGETLAYVLGRLVDASRGQTRYSLHLRGAAPGAVPAEVKLQAGEQVATPSF